MLYLNCMYLSQFPFIFSSHHLTAHTCSKLYFVFVKKVFFLSILGNYRIPTTFLLFNRFIDSLLVRVLTKSSRERSRNCCTALLEMHVSQHDSIKINNNITGFTLSWTKIQCTVVAGYQSKSKLEVFLKKLTINR